MTTFYATILASPPDDDASDPLHGGGPANIMRRSATLRPIAGALCFAPFSP